MTTTIKLELGERICCAVFGDSTTENQRTFHSLLRMPALGRFMVIGRDEAFLTEYLAMPWAMPVEVYDEGTPPPAGLEVIVLTARNTEAST